MKTRETRVRTLPWASSDHVTTQSMSPQRLSSLMLTFVAQATKMLPTCAKGQTLKEHAASFFCLRTLIELSCFPSYSRLANPPGSGCRPHSSCTWSGSWGRLSRCTWSGSWPGRLPACRTTRHHDFAADSSSDDSDGPGADDIVSQAPGPAAARALQSCSPGIDRNGINWHWQNPAL